MLTQANVKDQHFILTVINSVHMIVTLHRVMLGQLCACLYSASLCHLAIDHAIHSTVTNIVLVIVVCTSSIHGFSERDVHARLNAAGPFGYAMQPLALRGALHDQHVAILQRKLLFFLAIILVLHEEIS